MSLTQVQPALAAHALHCLQHEIGCCPAQYSATELHMGSTESAASFMHMLLPAVRVLILRSVSSQHSKVRAQVQSLCS
jgi:hypothetical protein